VFDNGAMEFIFTRNSASSTGVALATAAAKERAAVVFEPEWLHQVPSRAEFAALPRSSRLPDPLLFEAGCRHPPIASPKNRAVQEATLVERFAVQRRDAKRTVRCNGLFDGSPFEKPPDDKPRSSIVSSVNLAPPSMPKRLHQDPKLQDSSLRRRGFAPGPNSTKAPGPSNDCAFSSDAQAPSAATRG
jgi:hypothetical protein